MIEDPEPRHPPAAAAGCGAVCSGIRYRSGVRISIDYARNIKRGEMPMFKRIAVMGAGSLGTAAGAFLTRKGYDVTLVDADQAHVDALNSTGAHIVGPIDVTIPVKACCAESMEGQFDLFLYMAKQTCNHIAVPQMLAHSHDKTAVICCQNGLPEMEVEKWFPRERIFGAPWGWGGIFQGPGCTQLTSEVEFMSCTLGSLSGEHTSELDEAAELLGSIQHVQVSDNLMGLRWSKLLVNAAYSGVGTITGYTFGQIIVDPELMKIASYVGRECMRTAHACGVKVEPFHAEGRFYDFETLFTFEGEPDLELEMKMAEGYLGPSGTSLASMCQDIRRGRPCEIDYINGAVSRLSREHGVKTPVNDQITSLIRRISAGELPYERGNAGKIILG